MDDAARQSMKILVESLPCFICRNKVFSSLHLLIDHFRLYHDRNICNFDCILCSLSYGTLVKYRRHILEHLQKEHSNYYAGKRGPVYLCDTDLEQSQSHVHLPDHQQPNIEIDPITVDETMQNPCTVIADNNIQPEKNIIEDFHEILQSDYISYILKLCSFPELSTKRVFEIMNCESQRNVFKDKMISQITKDYDNSMLKELIKQSEDILNEIKTPYLFFKYIEQLGVYCRPTDVTVYRTLKTVTKQGQTKLINVHDKVSIFNLQFVLKNLFEIPGLLKKMLLKKDKLMSEMDTISNYVQGKVFRDICSRNPEKIIIPYFLYNDDVEISSAKGHNNCKNMMSIYTIVFPLLEDYQLSSVEFMFPVAFSRSNITKTTKKDACISKLIEQMDDCAKNGIELKIGNEKIRVHFTCALIIGDNKALHELLGHSESFIDEYICRNCIMKKADRQKAVEENVTLLRKPEDYDTYVATKTFGVKRACLFNQITEFHVTKNFYHDLFHDVYFRVLKDGLQDIIDVGLRTKIFDVHKVKNLFDSFDYGDIDSATNRLNKSIFDDTGKLRLTGSECAQIMKYFSLVMGDLYKNNNAEYLKYVHTLENLVKICLAETFDSEKIEKLKEAVKTHHKKFLEICKTEKTIVVNNVKKQLIEAEVLKPKHHFMLHYYITIINSGPLKYLWTMRLESHLRDAKKSLESAVSRVNPAYTLCKKYALKFASFLIKYKKGNFVYIDKGPNKTLVLNSKPYESNIAHSDLLNIKDEKKFNEFNHITYKGTTYKSNDKHYIFRVENKVKKLYKIKDIICQKDDEENIFLVVQKVNIESFDVHYNAHIVGEESDIYCIFNITKCGKPFNIHTLNNRKSVFKINEYLY